MMKTREDDSCGSIASPNHGSCYEQHENASNERRNGRLMKYLFDIYKGGRVLHISGKLAVVGIVLFIGGLIASFILAYVVGDPLAMYINETTPPSAIPGIIVQHGLDQPIHIQFFYYLRDLFSGNWGVPPEALMIEWWTITVIHLGGLVLFLVSVVYYLLRGRRTG